MGEIEDALGRHAAARRRVVDDHMFTIKRVGARPAMMRLQVFTSPGAAHPPRTAGAECSPRLRCPSLLDIVVNIDLSTDKALTAPDAFRPAALTPTGIADSGDRMVARTSVDQRDFARVCFSTPSKRAGFDPGPPA